MNLLGVAFPLFKDVSNRIYLCDFMLQSAAN